MQIYGVSQKLAKYTVYASIDFDREIILMMNVFQSRLLVYR